jgi:hypothetical protein
MGGDWKSTVGFTLDGTEVRCTPRTTKFQDGKLDLAYDFEIQGVSLRSKLKGEWTGTEMKGSYETDTTDGSQNVDSGSWTVTRKK